MTHPINETKLREELEKIQGNFFPFGGDQHDFDPEECAKWVSSKLQDFLSCIPEEREDCECNPGNKCGCRQDDFNDCREKLIENLKAKNLLS